MPICLPKRHISEHPFQIPNRQTRKKEAKPTRRRTTTQENHKTPNRTTKATRPIRVRGPQVLKQQGLCRCGQQAILNQTRCPECAEQHRAWNRQRSEKHRTEKGITISPRIDETELLALIQKETAARDSQRVGQEPDTPQGEPHEQQQVKPPRSKAERKGLGLCVDCATPSVVGQTRCTLCALKHRLSDLRRRAKTKLNPKP